MYNIAITGHRPKDLGGLTQMAVRPIAWDMLDRAEARAGANPVMIHTGGALGIDQWVAWATINSPYYDQTVFHTLHMPFVFDIMTNKWNDAQKSSLDGISNSSTGVCTHCPRIVYDPRFYQDRNRHMVDSSEVLVAFWTGKRTGGTWNAIAYAWEKQVPIYNALDSMNRVRI